MFQHAVIDFLAEPATHGERTVERIDTHSAVVFLAGDRALKLKRAVRFDYLDFSTEALRRRACEAEVAINRRTAPSIYRGVVAVTREQDGSFALGGPGEPVDWCVDMKRFDQALLLDRLAERRALDEPLVRRLAAEVARFHLSAEPRPDYGGAAAIQRVIEGNAHGFAEQGQGALDVSACQALTRTLTGALARRAPLLDRRRADGFVRHCHGDLHLRNLVLLDGVPAAFDGIEFNDDIACIDVFYDLAFLLMDLWARGLVRDANIVLNGYLAATGDFEGLAALPLFLACRSAVRAKTSATAARVQATSSLRNAMNEEARRYLALAQDLAHPLPPVLMAIGGRSGTGKSTLARALAPGLGAVPGAVLLRSDEIRKALCGVEPFARLPESAYAPGVAARVYRLMADRAHAALGAGQSVITDAVFAHEGDRATIESVAGAAKVPFVGLWLAAPIEALVARVTARAAAASDASDADAGVVRRQVLTEPGPHWRRLDATAPLPVIAAAARGDEQTFP